MTLQQEQKATRILKLFQKKEGVGNKEQIRLRLNLDNPSNQIDLWEYSVILDYLKEFGLVVPLSNDIRLTSNGKKFKSFWYEKFKNNIEKVKKSYFFDRIFPVIFSFSLGFFTHSAVTGKKFTDEIKVHLPPSKPFKIIKPVKNKIPKSK